MPKHYWLVKSEADCFSIHDLASQPDQTTCWSGVRNFQARNYLRDGMKLGDRVLFHHSNAEPAAVAGTAVVVREAYPDHTAWDSSDEHFDPKASPENPIWQMVDLQLESIFPQPLGLPQLRGVPELKAMELLRKGSRLSVQPVTKLEFDTIVKLAKGKRKSSKTSRTA
jgi:predicted RNA-binding protein with PUA-like domain